MKEVYEFCYGNKYEGDFCNVVFETKPDVKRIIDVANSSGEFWADAVYRNRAKLKKLIDEMDETKWNEISLEWSDYLSLNTKTLHP